jgi:hypothetical protein
MVALTGHSQLSLLFLAITECPQWKAHELQGPPGKFMRTKHLNTSR